MAGGLFVLVFRAGPQSRVGDREYIEKIRDQLCDVVAMNVESVENISYQFIANSELNRMLKAYTTSGELYQIAQWNETFSAFLESQGGTNPLIRDAAFFDLAEVKRKPLTMSDNLSSETLRAVRSSRFFERTVSSSGKAEWQGPEVVSHGGKKSLLCGRAIMDRGSNLPLGVLVLFVRSERLAEIVNSELYTDGEPEESSVGNYFNLIVHGSGTILSSPVKSQVGLGADASFGESGVFLRELAAGREKGESRLVWRDTPVLVSFRRIPGTDFYLLETSTRPKGGFTLTTFVILAAILSGAALAFAPLLLAGVNRKKPAADGPGESPDWVESLPPRELEILLLVAEGKSNKEIAFALSLKEQTVKNYVRSLYEKLGIHDRVSASLLVNKAGLGRGFEEKTAR